MESVFPCSFGVSKIRNDFIISKEEETNGTDYRKDGQ